MASYENKMAAEYASRNRGTMHLIMDSDTNKTFSTPRPASRVGASTDALEYLERNRGTFSSLGDQFTPNSPSSHYASCRTRVPPGEGQEIMRKSTCGSIADVLNVDANRGYCTARPAPRVPVDAEDNAIKGRGTMGQILDNQSNMRYNNPQQAPKVKPEADSNARQGRGTMDKVLDTNANLNFNNPRMEPRVKPEAADNAAKGKGMAGLVLQGKVPGDPVPGVRVKPEAEDIATKNKGSLTNMYYNYGKHAQNSQPNPKIRPDGQDIYNLGTNGVVHRLFHQYGNLPRDPKPVTRVRPNATLIASNNKKGTMETLMSGPKKTYKPRKSAINNNYRPSSSAW